MGQREKQDRDREVLWLGKADLRDLWRHGLHDIYRSLSAIAGESDYIQIRLFKNNCALSDRKTGIVYYDCTNFYFEIELAEAAFDGFYAVCTNFEDDPIPSWGLTKGTGRSSNVSASWAPKIFEESLEIDVSKGL